MSRQTDIAATALGTAAVAANAIPVAGQFASAGLAIASGLTKLFGNIQGPRKRRRARAAEAQRRMRERQMMLQKQQAQVQGPQGQLFTGQTPPMPTTTLQPQAPPAPVATQPTQNGPYNNG